MVNEFEKCPAAFYLKIKSEVSTNLIGFFVSKWKYC